VSVGFNQTAPGSTERKRAGKPVDVGRGITETYNPLFSARAPENEVREASGEQNDPSATRPNFSQRRAALRRAGHGAEIRFRRLVIRQLPAWAS
jgi:hypothetical protein